MMSFRKKKQIAQEINCHHEIMFFFTCIVMAALFTVLPLLIRIRAMYQMEQKDIPDGMSVSAKNAVTVQSNRFSDDGCQKHLFIDFDDVDGILGYGESFPGENYSYVREECFPELSDYIRKNVELRKKLCDENGIISTLVEETLWDIMNITIEEGVSPQEADRLYPNTDGTYQFTRYVYYGSDMEERLPIGTERIYQGGREDHVILWRYIVAGYLKKGSFVYMGEDNGGEDGLLDKAIVEVDPETVTNAVSMHILFDESMTRDEVEQELSAQSDNMEIWWRTDELAAERRAYDSLLKGLLQVTVIILVAGSIMISMGQIIHILSESKQYGIWYSCGMTRWDCISILFLQNCRKMESPLICGALSAWLSVGALSGNEELWKFSGKEVSFILLQIYPVLLITATLITIVTTLIPTLVLGRKMPIDLLKER